MFFISDITVSPMLNCDKDAEIEERAWDPPEFWSASFHHMEQCFRIIFLTTQDPSIPYRQQMRHSIRN